MSLLLLTFLLPIFTVLWFRMGSRPVGKRVISSCLLHDWILYSMGIVIPSIHLVSFCFTGSVFLYLIFFPPNRPFLRLMYLATPPALLQRNSVNIGHRGRVSRHWCIELLLSNVF
jgi:hypothetical protein